MNRFDNTSKKNRILSSIPFSVIFFAAIIVLFIAGVSFISNKDYFNEEKTLKEAIDKDVAHCYAVEGKYPENVEYLEKKYGLSYDHSKFIINYESVGSNIYPVITVIERSK